MPNAATCWIFVYTECREEVTENSGTNFSTKQNGRECPRMWKCTDLRQVRNSPDAGAKPLLRQTKTLPILSYYLTFSKLVIL